MRLGRHHDQAAAGCRDQKHEISSHGASADVVPRRALRFDVAKGFAGFFDVRWREARELSGHVDLLLLLVTASITKLEKPA
jgi:hypothetical protein